jgi:hypothetical protein
VNVVLQENLESLVFKDHKEFKVLRANVVILVHLAHKEKRELSVIREKWENEVQGVHLVLLEKKVVKAECPKRTKEYSKSC